MTPTYPHPPTHMHTPPPSPPQAEVQDLKSQLSEAETAPAASGRVRSSEEDVLSLIGSLVGEMNENIEERINLQKALFEIEDTFLTNKAELKQLEEFLDAGALGWGGVGGRWGVGVGRRGSPWGVSGRGGQWIGAAGERGGGLRKGGARCMAWSRDTVLRRVRPG